MRRLMLALCLASLSGCTLVNNFGGFIFPSTGDGGPPDAGTDAGMMCAAACPTNAHCQGTQCLCDPGFMGDGTTCTDIDECATGTADCDVNATCTDQTGSYACACNANYTGDGRRCIPSAALCSLYGTDAFGYVYCVDAPAVMPCDDIRTTGTNAALTDDSLSLDLPFGFDFDFSGVVRSSGTISSNGKLGFPPSTSYTNEVWTTDPVSGAEIPPATCQPMELETIAAYWDDLLPEMAGGAVYYQALGTAPERRFVVQWNVTGFRSLRTELYDIRLVLYEGSNDIELCYVNTTMTADNTMFPNETLHYGQSSTVGIRGSGAELVVSCRTPSVPNGTRVRFYHP